MTDSRSRKPSPAPTAPSPASLTPHAHVRLPPLQVQDVGHDNSISWPPCVCVSSDATQILFVREDGEIEIRTLDQTLSLAESFPVPEQAGRFPLTFSSSARVILWGSSPFDFDISGDPFEGALTEACTSAFGAPSTAPLSSLLDALAVQGSTSKQAIDGDDLLGALFHEDALWLVLLARRGDDVSLSAVRHAHEATQTLALAHARAGDTWSRLGFGPVRLLPRPGGVHLSVADVAGSQERFQSTVLLRDGSLTETSQTEEVTEPESWRWPAELRHAGAAPTEATLPGLASLVAELEHAQDLIDQLELDTGLPWENAPRLVQTPEGSALLALLADEEGYVARTWLLPSSR